MEKILPEDIARAKALGKRLSNVPVFMRTDESWLKFVSEAFAEARVEIEARIHGHDLTEDEEEARS